VDRSDLFGLIGRSAFVATVESSTMFEHRKFDPSSRTGTQSRSGPPGAVVAVAGKQVNDQLNRPQSTSNLESAHSTVLENEADLVAQARMRNKQAYQILVERYQSRLLAAAIDIVHSRADAEDIVQNAFVKAYLSLSAFEGKSSFFTWLYRIVHNLAIDERRRRARHGGETVELESLVGHELANRVTVDGPYDRVLRQQQAHAIAKVLNMITPDHRSVILLREVDGLSYDEISQALNISRGTVMSRLHYARKKLQQLLKEFAPNDTALINASQDAEKNSPQEDSNSGERYEHSI